jgi:peptidoglycan/xylan/chitin deacetylase (PgdA/CDA1 family)
MSLRTRRFARHTLPALCLLSTAFAAGCGETEAPAGDEHLHGDEEGAAFEAAFLEKDDAKADSNNCSGVRLPDQGDFGGRVALTFDDGPNAHTSRVIATLRARGIPAAFFMKGSNTEGASRQAVVADLGQDPLFIVANHSWSHADLSKQTIERVGTEIDRTNSSLADATGEPTQYFRFPYGAATCASADLVRARGMTITGWHVDSADWCFAAGGGTRCNASTFRHVPDGYRDDMVGYVLSQVRSYNGGIVLFHDVHGSTADALPQVLDALIAAGYTFTSLDDAEAFPRLNGETPAPQPFVGTACTTDDQCNFASGEAEGLCHFAGYCVLACAGACPDRDGHAPTFCIADEFQRVADGPGGICVPQASDLNGDCADLPGTLDLTVDRFVGMSGASVRQARACVPVESEPVPAE